MGAQLDLEKQINAHETPGSETNRGYADKVRRVAPVAGEVSAPRSGVTALDRWVATKMMEVVGNPPIELKLWDGKVLASPSAQPVASLQYHSRAAMFKTIINPELHFGDLYSSGQVSVEGDLVALSRVVYANLEDMGRGGWLRRFVIGLGHRRIANSLARAEDNIHHHYDLGNDFYQLWLYSAEMQYTCAYFPDPAMTLEQAQVAKLHHVCRKLELEPGDSVVEAGCGWGGLALFMARHYGVRVKAYNISKEQVAFAHQRAEKEGLADRVQYVLDDYRNIDGEYDKFVSVGMLEHVGIGDYPVLGQVVDRCLKPDGRGLIHTIGRNRPAPMNAWIERRIFPGAYPPSLKEMMAIFEPNRLSVLDVENLRMHYAKTLRGWMERYEQHEDEVTAMMDPEFVRAWRLYLAGSIAAFEVGELQLFQVVFARARNNELPWSRAHIYSGVAATERKQKQPAEA